MGVFGASGYPVYKAINPTGSEWLLSSGYIFNPPKLTSHKSKDNNCSENLFTQDPDFDSSKVYGCRVVSINIWNNSNQSRNQLSNYIILVDQLSIRKGNDGWQIITLINSREGAIKYIQMTIYENQKHGWTQKLIAIGSKGIKQKPNPIPSYNWISCDNKSEKDKGQAMLSENKYLKFAPNNVSWYEGVDLNEGSSSLNVSGSITTELSEIWKESRSESWIWLETENQGSAILEGFDFFEFPRDMWELYRTSKCKQTYFSGRESLDHNTANFMWQQYNNEIKKWTNKGKWTRTEEFCELGNKRSIDTKQQKNLKLFCAKPRS